MRQLLRQTIPVAGIICLLASCASDEKPGLMKGQVICQGGCLNQAFYVEVAQEYTIGKAQTVLDRNGVNRGQFTNIVVINNLKPADQHEKAAVVFRSFKDVEFSCQSSYPRLVREIEIAY